MKKRNKIIIIIIISLIVGSAISVYSLRIVHGNPEVQSEGIWTRSAGLPFESAKFYFYTEDAVDWSACRQAREDFEKDILGDDPYGAVFAQPFCMLGESNIFNIIFNGLIWSVIVFVCLFLIFGLDNKKLPKKPINQGELVSDQMGVDQPKEE